MYEERYVLCASRTCGRCGDEQGSPLAVPDEKSRQFEKRLCDFRQARCAFVSATHIEYEYYKSGQYCVGSMV